MNSTQSQITTNIHDGMVLRSGVVKPSSSLRESQTEMDEKFIEIYNDDVHLDLLDEWLNEQETKMKKKLKYTPIEYRISMTGIGAVVIVYHLITKNEIDITNYDDW